MQFFQRYKNKCEHKVNFDRGENGKDEVCFTITITYRTLFHPIHDETESDVKIHEYGQGANGLSFDSLI